MIPKFPEFKKIELCDKEEIENITNQFPLYSDFHFVTIYCWDIDNSTLISNLNENLILKQIDCMTGEQFFSFIGINTVDDTVKEISDYLYQNNLPLILRWVPEESVNCLIGIEATVTEDRDYFDYIYDVDDFYAATGGKYKSYRNAISKFNRQYPNVIVKHIDIQNKTVKEQLSNLFKIWYSNKLNTNHVDEQLEFKALKKLLYNAENFKTLIGLGVYINDIMIAFAIEDIFDKEFGCGLFWKANINYSGIYNFLQNETLKLYHCKGIKYMNMESDIGIESLRNSKMRYHPSFFLKKYKIEISVPVYL